MSKRSANQEIVDTTITALTPKGRELMTAVGLGQFSFFDSGIVEGSGIWGEIMAGEHFSSARSASGVMGATKKLGLWETSEDPEANAGLWWSLTALGAAVANELAAHVRAEEPALPAEPTVEAESAPAPVEQAEEAPLAPEATYDARGNYNTVFVPLAELLATDPRHAVRMWTVKESAMLVHVNVVGAGSEQFVDLLQNIEADAVEAMRVWMKTLDRKGLTDMEKYNQNRSFLAGFGAAIAKRASGSKQMPVVTFARDMEKALRPEALKAGHLAAKGAEVAA